MGHANVPQPIQLLAFGIFHLLLSGDCQRLAKPVRTEMSCPSIPPKLYWARNICKIFSLIPSKKPPTREKLNKLSVYFSIF